MVSLSNHETARWIETTSSFGSSGLGRKFPLYQSP